MAAAGQRIVGIAVDGSELADNAFNWAMENIVKDTDFIVVVHSAEYKNMSKIGAPGFTDPVQISNDTKQEEERISHLIAKYAEILKKKAIKGKVVRTGAGKAGETIITACEQANVNMIVVGSRGLGHIKRAIMGSVSDYSIRHAKVPVTVYRID